MSSIVTMLAFTFRVAVVVRVIFVVHFLVDVRGSQCCFCSSIECIFNKYFILFYFCFKLSLLLCLLWMCYYFCFPSFIFTINVTDIMCAKHHYAVDQLKFSKLKRVCVWVCTYALFGCHYSIYRCTHYTLRRSFYFVAANENIIELNFQLSRCFIRFINTFVWACDGSDRDSERVWGRLVRIFVLPQKYTKCN